MGDSHVGLQARLMSQALRKLTGGLNQTQTSMIFINQLREKIGVFFGSPETTAGGKALKFYASVRLDIRRIETLKDGTDAVGNRTRVKVVKNKMAPPFKQAEFDILYGIGISREGSLIDFGVEHEIVRKSGAWYTYDGDQLGQGKENARRYLLDNPATAQEIENKILAKLGHRCGTRGRSGRGRVDPAEDRPAQGRGRLTVSDGVDGGEAPQTTDATSERGRIAAVIPLAARRGQQGAPSAAVDHPEEVAEPVGEVAFLPGVREADERRAENVSMHGLARRGMSRAEVLDLLQRREIDPIVAEAEIARLEGSGLIDDDALARTLVERLTERKKLGPSALRAELQRRRLSTATIEIALAEREVEDEGALLDGLVDDRLRRMGSLDRETAERRLLAFLARKGHGGSAARDSVRRALDEAGLEPAPRTGFGQRAPGGGFGQRGGSSGGFGRSGGSGGSGGFGRRPSAASSRHADGPVSGPRAVEFE